MRHLLPVAVILSALTGGCAMSIPDTPPYPPSPAASDPLPGASFCARTETAARSLSSAQTAGGWVLGGLGLASTGTGVVAALINVQEGRRIAATGLTLGGMALGAVAAVLFVRAEASARLAQATNMALLERNDRRAYETCVTSKGAWEGAKGDPEAITREMLARQTRERRRLEDEIEQLHRRLGDGRKHDRPHEHEPPPPLVPRP
jgi:hypothetical protein